MKRLLLVVLVVFILFSFVACGKKGETPEEGANTPNEGSSNTPEEAVLSNEEMYGELITKYQDLIAEFDLGDVEAEEKLPDIVSDTLIMHIARYAQEGVSLTYAFYDIDKNGVDELLIGADNGLGAIYSYDKDLQTVVKIAFLDTLERGAMHIYDNGVIMMEGSGGAALHYFEFGLIGTDGKSYQQAEYIMEKYEEDSETPKYYNAETEELLEYQSFIEIKNKYIGNAQEYVFGDAPMIPRFEMTNPGIDPALEGSWANDSLGEDKLCTYTFRADGSGTYDVAGSLMSFTYQTQDSHIAILFEGDEVSLDTTYSITGDMLTVVDSLGEGVLYQKVQ